MTAPLTDQQLAAIEAGRAAVRAKLSGGAFPAALGQAIADELADAAMAPVLAKLDEAQRAYIFDTAELKRDNDQLRAELAETDILAAAAGSWKLRGSTAEAEVTRLRAELADWQAANQHRLAEIAKAFRYLDAGDAGSARSVLVTAGGGTDRLNAHPACTCGARPVHQNGCDADQDN